MELISEIKEETRKKNKRIRTMLNISSTYSLIHYVGVHSTYYGGYAKVVNKDDKVL